MAGCCIHIATVVYFFSNIIHNMNAFKDPAKHQNQIFINTIDLEAPNRPMVIKNTRKRY